MNQKYHKTRNILSILILLPLLVVATACENSSIPLSGDSEVDTTDLTVFSNGLENNKKNGKVAAQLAEVRRATAHFHDHEKGVEAGWFIPLSPCVEFPQLGGMGYHYGNPEYLGNGIIDPIKPEVLLYEPQKNGRFRLVGVEYIAPFLPPEIEGGNPIQGDQPSLFGQDFHDSPHVGEHGAWTLHVWLWRNNPSGMFEDWNPKVNCDYAPAPVEE